MNIPRSCENKTSETNNIFKWGGGRTEVFEAKKTEISQFRQDIEKVKEPPYFLRHFVEITDFRCLQQSREDHEDKANENKSTVEETTPMERQVNYWSDYLSLDMHERSFVLVNEFQNNSSSGYVDETSFLPTNINCSIL